MLCTNLAIMIRECKAAIEDLKAFSRQLQCDVRTLLGDDKEGVLGEFYGLMIEKEEQASEEDKDFLGGSSSVAEVGGMKVLILGNGFDIAHGLPMQYKDFLNFADSVLFTYI